MEKEQFAATEPEAWWLLVHEVDYRIEEGRRALGETAGWTDPRWYAEHDKLEDLYRRLDSSHHQLLVDLDHLTYDEQRVEWLVSATKALSPAPTPEPDTPAAESARPAAGTSPPTGSATAAPKPSPFARKQAPASEPAAQAAPAAEVQTVGLDAAVHDVLGELSGDKAADLAGELGLTVEEVTGLAHDPDFERMVAEEAAKLVAQRSE